VTATPTSDRKTSITAAARWISDCGSMATTQRRSWTTCRSLEELALLADLQALLLATDRGLADLQGAATEPWDEADFLNASGGGLPERAKKAREWTETARVLKTFGSWVHILVNGKSDLQNSWRYLIFLFPF